MASKLKQMIADFLKAKGHSHKEDQVVERYMYDSKTATNLYKKPTPNPGGDKEYIRKEQIDVPDVADDEIDTTIRLEQQKTLDLIAELQEKMLNQQEQLNKNVKTIKTIAVVFAVLMGISIILAIIQAATIASMFN